MIAIIDYGMGNLGSVSKAFQALGAKVKVTQDRADLRKADKIVLPGVGAFKDTMAALKELGMAGALKQELASGKMYLGICLGLEVLFEESHEGGLCRGLGLASGDVVRFDRKGLKVPHMGWNQVRIKNKKCPLFRGIEDNSFFYFVHSYYVRPREKGIIAAVTDYGGDFTSMIFRDNVFAVQFHPEKSQATGIRFLKNFIRL